jgi:hypothetical protein
MFSAQPGAEQRVGERHRAANALLDVAGVEKPAERVLC